MKLLLFLMATLSLSSSYAVTRGQFAGMQMIVNISSVTYDGSVDASAQNLFEQMDRPEQDSIVGRGKSLMPLGTNILDFICAKRGEGNYHCAIYIHSSRLGKIGPGRGYFEARGEEASYLFNQFHSNGTRFYFKDDSGTFLVDGTPDRFIIKYAADGV